MLVVSRRSRNLEQLDPDDESRYESLKHRVLSPSDTASHPRRLQSSTTSLSPTQFHTTLLFHVGATNVNTPMLRLAEFRDISYELYGSITRCCYTSRGRAVAQIG